MAHVPTIVLFGKNGQVGWELQRSLAPLGRVIALDRSSTEWCGELSRPEGIARTLRECKPDIVVNAAAHTAVDKAESEPALVHAINAHAPAVMAEEAQKLGAWMVHYSTDYVFDGSGAQYRTEDAATAPLSVYGQSKLSGETAVQAGCERHLIFRTSWVYGMRGGNFAKTMIRLAQKQEALRVISDQIGAPTGADLIADVTALALSRILQGGPSAQPLGGLYHLVAAGETNWFDYAKFVLAKAQQQGLPLKVLPENIQAIPTSAYPTAAQRPHNSRLANGKLQTAFGLHMPPWHHGLERMLAMYFSKNQD
jgi:dTDP-4-dehydrorhamnose reductase